jgi:uncharacterized protein YecE (DUF72 family)
VDELLRCYNCAFCIYELEHHLSPLKVTADFLYIRLHGPGNKYQGSYTDAELKSGKSNVRNGKGKVKMYMLILIITSLAMQLLSQKVNGTREIKIIAT